MTFPRGSEWRRWDLHVHSPYSVLNNEFGTDFDVYARRLLEAAAQRQIAAIGITDYFSVSGYRELRRRLADPAWLDTLEPEVRDHAATLLVIANVELRGFVIAGTDRRDSRVNYHVLFADDLSADDIEQHFLSRLRFTAASAPQRQDERWPLTEWDLTDLGTRLKEQHAALREPPLVVGMMNAVVDHEEVTNVLQEQPSRFEGKFLLVAPVDEDLAGLNWNSQGHLARKLFIQKADMLFSANEGTRQFSLGLRHASVEGYLAEFVSLKPCIHGSDAHGYDRLFEPDERRYNWIKADPTWRGLAMLLNEPVDRVFIGPRPPQHDAIAERHAKTIASVTINRSAGATTPEVWFANSVPLNPGVSAIIGNRGNGKSALAEVIGLLGDTQRTDSFSFLGGDRFRSPRIGKADQFEATVTWGDGSTQGPRLLSVNPPGTAVERVRYIAQGYLEEICNEIDRGETSRFYRELQDVIFSHVSEADRRGEGSLASLLSALGDGIDQEIGVLYDEVRSLNRRIIELGDQARPDYRQRLDAQLAELNRQLAAHAAAQPAEVPAPEAETDRQGAEELQRLRAEIEALDERIAAARREDAHASARRAAAVRLLDRVRAIQASVRGLADEGAADARTVGIDLGLVINLRVDTGAIDEVIGTVDLRRDAIRAELDPAGGGLAGQRSRLIEQRAGAEEQLSLPQRRRQEYLNAMSHWEARRVGLVGDASSPNTVAGLTAQLQELEHLPAAIGELVERRRTKVEDIYRAKERLREQYAELHSPVSRFLEDSEVAASEAFRLRFAAQIVETGLPETLLAMIDQRRVGALAGVDEGRAKLEGLLTATDWSSMDEAVAFPANLMALLSGEPDSERRIQDQLRQGFSEQDLVDFLFGLGYLAPTYKLTWDDRPVSELSPGERGNLLLIFYLLVDRNDIPLIIDQPEENLDNQTVYKTLVPCMRDVRRRRQVIVVTHNPNLAVVCDADQVIYAEIRKDGTNTVYYESGAIEDPVINRRLIDVLEGTKPAFNRRAAKYLLG